MGTMFKALFLSALAVCCCFSFFLGSLQASAEASSSRDGGERPQQQQVYIVYMGHQHEPSSEVLPGGFSAAKAAHHRLLNQVLDDGSDAMDRIIYSYTRSMNGFAARLTEAEKQRLSSKEGVVSVFPSRTYQLQTTRSWDFLGFPETARRSLPTAEADVIVGMIDTGVWPLSPSFSDDGFGPPPRRWKGTCHNFTCNNKIIGARAYKQGKTGLSAVDTAGHGSHTASTVAGRAVEGASLGGLAGGTARGAVPGARLAVYKACWDDFCAGEDMLAAFDDAAADGVDVVSFSIGNRLPAPYLEDAAAIGALHAARRGVLTSAAAGNSALDGGRVCNVAPWILSVAASSTDRRLVAKLVLGNGSTIVGASINIFPKVKKAPLVLPTNITGSCAPESLAGQSYKGKILLCIGGNGTGPLLAGAAGAVIVNGEPDVAFMLPLPALTVSNDQFAEIMAYVNNTRKPVGTICSTETAFDSDAPTVASFSSRGPNLISPGILKPDLAAPGVDILAAWTPLSPVSGNGNDNRFAAYSIDSGTSMACPHATGVAAYVKSFHRHWSPAMIMSALITTATPMDPSRNPGGGELVYGAGQLNPARARDPGLVYDAGEEDYVRMLCAEGYNSTQLRAVTGSDATACPAAGGGGTAADLNYPTMAHRARPGKNFTVRFPRTVTNVGAHGSVYTVKIAGSGPYVRVAVKPRRLAFRRLHQRLSFTVMVSGALPDGNEFVSAAVVWSDGVRHVRSPIIVHTVDVPN